MDTISFLIDIQLGDRLMLAGLAYVAFVLIMAIGAWEGLRK